MALTGRRGDGFVFDTNALHRATAAATKARSVLMLEMNAAAKSRELRRWARAPCPTSSDFLQPLPREAERDLDGEAERKVDWAVRAPRRVLERG